MAVRKVKLQKIGNSVGVILPKEVLSRLHAEVGDEFSVADAPGQVTLFAHDIEVEQQIETGLKLMRKHRNVLHALAK